MKKLILFISILFSVILLTGCEKVIIVPNMINVVYENPRYDDGSFYIDINITNGTKEDFYIEFMEFSINPEGVDLEVAGASFEIDENIKAGKYVSIELAFNSEFVFVTETELSRLGYSLDGLELYFWIV